MLVVSSHCGGMEELCRAIVKGEQCVPWLEFQAATKEVYSDGEMDQSDEGAQSVSESAGGVEGGQGVSWLEFQASSDGDSEQKGPQGVSGGGATKGVQEMMSGVKVELENRELWKQFDEITNEMIITKAGR